MGLHQQFAGACGTGCLKGVAPREATPVVGITVGALDGRLFATTPQQESAAHESPGGWRSLRWNMVAALPLTLADDGTR